MDEVSVRECHMGRCPECDAPLGDRWETSIALEDALARIDREPEYLDELEARSCGSCGHRLEWDIAIVDGGDELPQSRQDELFATLRRLIPNRVNAPKVARTIREEYGVIAFYVER